MGSNCFQLLAIDLFGAFARAVEIFENAVPGIVELAALGAQLLGIAGEGGRFGLERIVGADQFGDGGAGKLASGGGLACRVGRLPFRGGFGRLLFQE